MSTYVLMKILESAPSRYDRGIRLLTLGRLDKAYDHLVSYVKTGQRVIDLGCGTGALTLRAARKGAMVKGIDIKPQMLEIAHMRALRARLTQNRELYEMGVAELGGEESKTYDVVMSGLCFSELTEDELAYTLREVKRILKPGGVLLAADEVRPTSISKRILNWLVRLPLVIIAYIITQTTTHAVRDLPERVKRALKGINAYLLIANSRGINVWCGAAGGHFTSHNVISVLKTSGIEELVDHRKVVLPQLAATGVEAKTVQEKTGWRVVWGPVYANHIPIFLKNGFKKTPEMREVNFSWHQRTETAVAWAFPISLIAALILLPFWRDAIPYLVGLVWGLSFLIFLSFPLYSQWLGAEGRRVGFVFFDFGRGGFQLILWVLFIVALVAYEFSTGAFTWGLVLRWGFASLIVILILSLDLMGSTPVYHSGLHEDRLLKVVLDRKKCRGAGFGEQVCPRNCYEVDREHHIATMPKAAQCVQCGACIVQCPFDALYFRSPKGEVIPPESIRKFKLNLIGKRLVRADGK